MDRVKRQRDEEREGVELERDGIKERQRERDGYKERETKRQVDRHGLREREGGKHTDGEKKRKRERERERENKLESFMRIHRAVQNLIYKCLAVFRLHSFRFNKKLFQVTVKKSDPKHSL